MPTPTKIADKWFSLYIRFRDALEFQKEVPDADISFGRCCTCGKIGQWKYMDCGHFISRGRGGGSGVRWDERNAHLQCKPCNGGFYAGTNTRTKVDEAYKQFMLEKYGQAVIDQLEFLDRNQSYHGKILGIGLMYKQMYEDLRGKDD